MFRPLKIVVSVAWSRNYHWAYIWSNERNLIVEVSALDEHFNTHGVLPSFLSN